MNSEDDPGQTFGGDDGGGGSPGPKKPSGHALRTTPRGVSAAQRKVQRQLAAQLREDMCPEFISRYWLAMAMGKDPRVELRDVDPKTGRNREGRPSAAPMTEQVPTLEQSANAMVQYILRRDGQPAKAEELEQRLGRGEAERTAVDPARLAGMSAAELREVVGALRKLRAPPRATALEPAQDKHASSPEPQVADEGDKHASSPRPVIDV